MDPKSVFVMGSPMTAMTAILIVFVMEHRMVALLLTHFRLDCSMAGSLDPTLDLPMASATEALTAHLMLARLTQICLDCSTAGSLDPKLDLPMASAMEALVAHRLVARLMQIRLDCSRRFTWIA